jgi:hypothetical protein
MWGHIRGWNIGGEVICEYNEEDGDTVTFYLTGGSNGGSQRKEIAKATIEKGMRYADAKLQLISKVKEVSDGESD